LNEAEALSKQFSQIGWQQFTKDKNLIGIHHTGAKATSHENNGKEKEAAWDTEQIRKKSRGPSISLPIELRGETIGSVDVRSPDNRPWDQDELDIVTAIVERGNRHGKCPVAGRITAAGFQGGKDWRSHCQDQRIHQHAERFTDGCGRIGARPPRLRSFDPVRTRSEQKEDDALNRRSEMSNVITNFFASPEDKDPNFIRLTRNILIFTLIATVAMFGVVLFAWQIRESIPTILVLSTLIVIQVIALLLVVLRGEVAVAKFIVPIALLIALTINVYGGNIHS
jgi:hypothetical protein